MTHRDRLLVFGAGLLLQELPDRLELLAGIAAQDVGHLGRLSVGSELGHLAPHIEPGRIKEEAAEVLVPHALADEGEIDPRSEERFLVPPRRLFAQAMALPAV